MLTSAQIRQSFLDFFREKQHTIVPSSSLLPDSPNLLFTNAGMNQFVPIFLGQTQCPYQPPRAADTQKCIRAGGKHNDLDDVGLDTYHHTFFEMLGNWSFGDYFKKEAIEWAWELIVERWGFPANRVYATVYSPDKASGDPSEFDQEAHDHWARLFTAAGLDPAVHIVNGNKKDNFWMMGETGPCGPCSELHVDLTLEGDTKGALVNKGDPRCIEIWNLVFIQFNANPDGTFAPLPAKHVDTGMGFERVASIIQGTKGFTDFASAKISNYETDIFRPIFDELEKLSGKHYGGTLPGDAAAPGSALVPSAGEGVPPSRTPVDLPTVEGASTAPDAAGSSSRRDAETSTRDARAPQIPAHPAQHQIDIAFRVIADHIRTLSFAIADGIQPGNTDRNYVLRRILRRAVRYGRTLGFHEPFFYKLVPVLARTMGDVFPEIRAKQQHIEEVLRREEDAFNKTLDKGIALFEAEAARLTNARSALGSTRAPRVVSGAPPESGRSAVSAPGEPPLLGGAPTTAREARSLPGAAALPHGATYSRRNLPHFERPWAKYMITFTTQDRRILSPAERDLVLETILHDHDKKYHLFAACVMPDHAHLIIEPAVKNRGERDEPEFFTLTEIMQTLKSVSAHRINKAADAKGQTVWQQESFDRMIRSEADLEEKFLYILDNPRRENLIGLDEEEYAWTWTPEKLAAAQVGTSPRRGAEDSTRGACAPHSASEAAPAAISGAFAFRLYDEQGFPLDLTELMARERGLSVDTAGFEKHMEEQRARARAAQKKQVIELADAFGVPATEFVGYDNSATTAEVLAGINATKAGQGSAIILDRTPLYTEMGGQVGDCGLIQMGLKIWAVGRTGRSGGSVLHFVDIAETSELPDPGARVEVSIDRPRRAAIQRHHTVTHLLHWALHEVVSKEATQKGSFVGPDKLTFDFNSAALTPQQVRDIERLVNERIVENSTVTWTEVPYVEVRGRAEIMQFFGDKYGETVRVVDIGGFSKELCAGTHTRATGEIGLFRIQSEAAIAAGVRRIEAIAGLPAYDLAATESHRLQTLATRIGAPLPELEKRVDVLLAQQKELERALKAASQREAAGRAKELLGKAETINDTPAIVANLGAADGDTLQAVADALKSHGYRGAIVLGGSANGAVVLIASVSPDFTAKVQAGKIIQAIAPLVGGKGGGKPDNARGGGKDPGKLDAALAHARSLLS